MKYRHLDGLLWIRRAGSARTTQAGEPVPPPLPVQVSASQSFGDGSEDKGC